jgi:predicted MFS family arabinose efflux permease
MLQATFQLYRNAYQGLSPKIWWLALVMFINRSGTMVIPFLTVYLTHRGYSLAQAGYAMAAFGAGSILGGYLGGRLTDRFGHFRVQVASLLLNGLLFLILGQMDRYAAILCCIFVLSSLGEAFRPANAAAIAAYSNDQNRTRCYSLNRLAVNLGWAIGPAVGGLLASQSYTLLFWADGLTCITAALVLFLLFRNQKEATELTKAAATDLPARPAHRDGIFMAGMGLLFLIGLCFFQLFSILPVYFKTEAGLGESTIGAVLAMNGLIIAAIEMVLVYRLENKRPALSYLQAGAFLIGVSYLVLLAGQTLGVILASMLVVTFGEMLLFPFLNNFWVQRSSAANRGQYAAIHTMAFSAAIVSAPTLAALLATKAGYPSLWIANFILCTIAAGGYYRLQQKMKKHERL